MTGWRKSYRILLLALACSAQLYAQQPESPQKIAFRYDKTHVVVQLAQTGESDVEGKPFVDLLEKMPLADARVAGIVSIGTSDELMSRHADLFGSTQPGQWWRVEADAQHRFPAKVESLAFAGTGCQKEINAVAILEITGATQQEFIAVAGSTFLAWPGSPEESRMPVKIGVVETTAKLGPGQGSEVKAALNAVMHDELAKAPPAKRTAAAQRLLKGQGKLEYDAQRLRLGPAGEERLYIRAKWMLGDFAAYMVTGFADPKRSMRLEGVSGGAPDWLDQSRPQFRSKNDEDELLGVFAGQNGWGAVLIGHHELDGYVVELLQYTPTGPERTDVAYGYGCQGD